MSYIIASLPGEPTVAEKAQKFIESLGLGDRPYINIRPKNAGKVSFKILANVTSIPRLRSRRAVGLPVVCPTSESEKSVCTDITGKWPSSIAIIM